MSTYKEYKRAHTILNILSSYEMKVDFNKNILSGTKHIKRNNNICQEKLL